LLVKINFVVALRNLAPSVVTPRRRHRPASNPVFSGDPDVVFDPFRAVFGFPLLPLGLPTVARNTGTDTPPTASPSRTGRTEPPTSTVLRTSFTPNALRCITCPNRGARSGATAGAAVAGAATARGVTATGGEGRAGGGAVAGVARDGGDGEGDVVDGVWFVALGGESRGRARGRGRAAGAGAGPGAGPGAAAGGEIGSGTDA
jgi:hypothetical protein